MVALTRSADTDTWAWKNDIFITIVEKDSKENLDRMQNKNVNGNISIDWNKKSGNQNMHNMS